MTRFSHPVLRAKRQIQPDVEVQIFVVHLKSKNPKIRQGTDPHDPVERAVGTARSLIIRAAEATALRCLFLKYLERNDKPAIVLGDINDSVNAVTSEIMTGSPPTKLRIWDMLFYSVKDIQARQSYRDVLF